MGKCREDLKFYSYAGAECAEYPDNDFIKTSEINIVYNEIEQDVNEALNILEPIQGLSEIDEAKKILKKIN